jgi:hypothetical protein
MEVLSLECVLDGLKFPREEVVPELSGTRAGNQGNREDSQEDLLDEDDGLFKSR